MSNLRCPWCAWSVPDGDPLPEHCMLVHWEGYHHRDWTVVRNIIVSIVCTPMSIDSDDGDGD
jgi:hypothetical protein